MPLATQGPVSPAGYLTTIAGDDYLAADARAPVWIDAAGLWPDLTAATVFLIAGQFSAQGDVAIQSSPPEQRVSVDIPGAEPLAAGEYDYALRAQLASGARVTLLSGKWVVAQPDGTHGMTRPTAADIRAWAPPDLPWSKLGLSAPVAGQPDPLEKRVDWAVGYVENTTWRPLITIKPPGAGQALPVSPLLHGRSTLDTIADTAVDMRPIAEQAVLLRVVQMIAQQSKSYFTATVLNDFISSFTAGSYSETRQSAETVLRGRGSSVENPLVNRWRELSDLLYLLMTPDAYAYWRYRLSGVAPPAGGFVEQNWSGVGERGLVFPSVWGQGLDSAVGMFPFAGV